MPRLLAQQRSTLQTDSPGALQGQRAWGDCYVPQTVVSGGHARTATTSYPRLLGAALLGVEPRCASSRAMAALCQQQRVSIAEAYAQLVGRGGVEACAGSSTPAIWQETKEHPNHHQPLVSSRASTATPSIRESTPALQRVGKLSGTAVRPFDPAGTVELRHQRRASMAASIERAKRVARAKWEAERPSILAELKQNRPSSNDALRRQASSREPSNRRSELPGAVWQPPPAADPEAGADRTADEELAQLRAQMQQMKQYVRTMEAMVSQQVASKAVAGPLVGETTRPSDPGITPDSQPQIALAPVAEDSAAEVESPLSTVDLDTQLLFETFETARHACAEVSEAEAEHGSMLERVSTSPLAKDKSRAKSPAAPEAQMSSTRSPLGMLRVDPNNARTRTSTSFSRLQPTKRSENLYAAGRGSPNAESPARPSVSPNVSFTDGGSPAAVATYTEYSEYEEYAESSDGSPAAPWGVPVSAAVVEGTEQRVVLRGRLSF